MSTLAVAAYVLLGVGIVAWVLTAGADFGGGLWDLIVRGEGRERDKHAIAHAIAPIWEANHVWLIFVIVVLFAAFPRAFAVIGVALHVPIAIGLVGIVLRGSAFTFRAYGLGRARELHHWGRVFGASSVLTPMAFGMALAGTTSSRIRVVGSRVVEAPVDVWWSPFAASVGLFAVALFALVAAAHLVADAPQPDVKDRFRRRALVVEVVAFVLAMGVLAQSRSYAPDLYAALLRSTWTWPLQGGTALVAIAASGALFARRYVLARALVVVQVTLVVTGFGAAMNGALVLRDVTIANSAAPDVILLPMLVAVVLGVIALVPALLWLYRIARSGLPSNSTSI
jgi:cytochrome d ubiquinol oxidase subunit II